MKTTSLTAAAPPRRRSVFVAQYSSCAGVRCRAMVRWEWQHLGGSHRLQQPRGGRSIIDDMGASRRLGIYFRGTLWSNYHEHRIIARKQADESPPAFIRPRIEWIECVKSRWQPSCTPEYQSRINVTHVLSLPSLKLKLTVGLIRRPREISVIPRLLRWRGPRSVAVESPSAPISRSDA